MLSATGNRVNRQMGCAQDFQNTTTKTWFRSGAPAGSTDGPDSYSGRARTGRVACDGFRLCNELAALGLCCSIDPAVGFNSEVIGPARFSLNGLRRINPREEDARAPRLQADDALPRRDGHCDMFSGTELIGFDAIDRERNGGTRAR